MAVLGDPAFELRLTHGAGCPGAVDALAWTILAMGLWGGLSLLACGVAGSLRWCRPWRWSGCCTAWSATRC
jgi:hypothetical protein